MDKQVAKIYYTSIEDPTINLALETYLIKNIDPNEVILLLWQNENTVVIGRNQNPYQECNLDEINRNNVTLVRRCSGGGAVYHDLGNLNFSFIASDKYYDVNKQLSVIIDALKTFGIVAEYSGRNDLVISNKKFSGNAFFSENSKSCHHGTLLIDVDVEKMLRYLNVSNIKIDSKAIKSVKSRVVNLSELNRDITIDTIKKSLYSSFEKIYGSIKSIEELNVPIETIRDEVAKNKSWNWVYSQSPSYSVTLSEKFNWAIVEFSYDVLDGKFAKCSFNTDALILDNFSELEKALISTEVKLESIKKIVDDTIINENVRMDISRLFEKYISCV
ncbi:lipoate--protein ligase [Abyssisolibacter fermentans]|uniref:lipoate--protein ligase n=1 Tax=Abyssisolibacter fermentans TaxID=1766203 RepID=UPI0008339120|nr:lipoate--protein ligase [Abyssisolibacter fermentans]